MLQDPDVISFAGGFPTKSTLPTGLIADITAKLMASDTIYVIHNKPHIIFNSIALFTGYFKGNYQFFYILFYLKAYGE